MPFLPFYALQRLHATVSFRKGIGLVLFLFLSSCVVQSDLPTVYSEQRCFYTPEGIYRCKVCYGSECRGQSSETFCYLAADSTVFCETYRPHYAPQVEWQFHYHHHYLPPPPRRHRGRPDDYPPPPPPRR
ncbi:hypothetical protein [uncultured Fibrobacter sp.]|uniref:hypothetical protein n=1 Tax=uncultured Fibrobacter sp. TaxID=261512 RepID=UPI002597E617|nr:hypothetical protein [uncultured Fibrobacter sp.]